MSKLISCSVIPGGKYIAILANKSQIYLIPSRGKRIPSHKKRFAGDGDYSHTDPGKLTDIRHYQALDKSHLHKWDARSPQRKFMIKLEEMEKRKFFSAERIDSRASLVSPEITLDDDPKEIKDRIESKHKVSDPIVIPTYIDRSPSTILRALASCVGRDHTAPDYKYHDDPFLIPYDSMSKRAYALAKDSGRQAARFVLDRHPELFQDNLIHDEPKISKYLPKIQVKGKERNVGFLKELLAQYIQSYHILGAIETYELLEKTPTGIEKLDEDTKMDLLELLCYHNNEEEMDSENHQLIAGMYSDDRSRSWRTDGLAEKLYSDIVTSKQYTDGVKDRARLTLLCGKGKFSVEERLPEGSKKKTTSGILQLKEEFELNGTKINLDGYNAVIRGLTRYNDYEVGKSKMLDVLKDMNGNQIKPDQQTLFNATKYILLLLSKNADINCRKDAQKISLSLLSEFRNVGVEPSLGTYENIIQIYGHTPSNAGKSQTIIFDVISELESQQKSGCLLKATIPDDFKFFHRAMNIISKINNVKLAYRTHKLLINAGDDGTVLLGEHISRQFYYADFLKTVLRNESIDPAMDLYSTLVPHLFSPNTDVYRALLKEVDAQSGHKHLPKIWTDLQSSNFGGSGADNRMGICERFAAAMQYADLPIFSDIDDPENDENVKLLKTFTLIGKQIFEDIKISATRRGSQLSSNMQAIPIFNHILDLSIRTVEDDVVDLDLVNAVVNFSREEITSLTGTLNPEVLLKIVQTIADVPLPGCRKLALDCVYYAAENRFPEAMKMAGILLKHFSAFDEIEKAQLNQLFAHDTEWTNL